MKEIIIPLHGIRIELDEDGGTLHSDLELEKGSNEDIGHAVLDIFETMILAHAVEGVDVASPGYIEGLKTVLDYITNEYGDL